MIIKKITSKQDGLKLEIAIMECKNPKGIVQFSHGMAEHKERYFDFMDISILKMRIILWRIYSRLRNMYVKCILD